MSWLWYIVKFHTRNSVGVWDKDKIICIADIWLYILLHTKPWDQLNYFYCNCYRPELDQWRTSNTCLSISWFCSAFHLKRFITQLTDLYFISCNIVLNRWFIVILLNEVYKYLRTLVVSTSAPGPNRPGERWTCLPIAVSLSRLSFGTGTLHAPVTSPLGPAFNEP